MNRLFSSTPRYVGVSGTCAVLNAALLIALDKVGLNYVGATLISGLIMIPLSYILHVRLTYRVIGGGDSFVRYAAAQVVNTPIALVLFFFIRGRADVPMIWAAPAVIGLMFAYNFTSSFWAIALRSRQRAKL